MRRILFALLLAASALMLPLLTAHGQTYAWCGFVMLENLPILRDQLAVFEAITPDASNVSAQPDELLQLRFSLNRSKILLEACYAVEPTRALVIALLDSVLEADYEVIDANLMYTVFGQGESHNLSGALAGFYIQSNLSEWEEQIP
jgi:hypothetical protein